MTWWTRAATFGGTVDAWADETPGAATETPIETANKRRRNEDFTGLPS
jgi:hypothetical protein